eukprot:47747-Chlamydomonas_euryale.AAC.7
MPSNELQPPLHVCLLLPLPAAPAAAVAAAAAIATAASAAAALPHTWEASTATVAAAVVSWLDHDL